LATAKKFLSPVERARCILDGLETDTFSLAAAPPHIHETEDEFFYGVKGEFKVKLGDHIMSAPAGSVMFVPRNTVFVIPIDLPNNASVKFSHLILLDTKFPRQIFNFAKCVFPFSNCDAVFTSRFFRKYHELPH
jgi:hypothetical protein